MMDGLFFIIEKILRFFEKMLSSGILYIILVIIGIIFLAILGIILFFWVKGDPSDYVSETYKIITSNATEFCKKKGFDSWRFVGREDKTDLEDRQEENLTFVCIYEEKNKTDLNKFYIKLNQSLI